MVYSYRFELDVNNDRAYTHGLCLLENVKSASWRSGMGAAFDSLSSPSTLTLTLDNTDGRYNTKNPLADYYGILQEGKLIRVRMTYNAVTVTMTELRIVTIMPSSFAGNADFTTRREVLVQATDKIQELLQWEYYPTLQENVRIDEALTEMHKQGAIVWPSEWFYFYMDVDSIDGTKKLYEQDDTDFNQALTSLKFVGDAMGRTNRSGSAQQFLRSILPGEVYGFYYFQPRTGKYTFRNRHHSTNTSVTTTIGAEYIVDAPVVKGLHPFGEGALNELELEYTPRAIGTPASVIYSSDNLPIRVSASDWKTIRGRYRDPIDKSAAVGAKNVIPMTRGVDFIGNSKADGTGEDWTQYLFVYPKPSASAIDINIYVRKVGDPVFVTTLQVRGTPITTYNKESITSRDELSIHERGRFPARASIPITDHELAQRMADLYVNTFSTPLEVLRSITIVVVPGIAAYVQTLTIGNKIVVQNRDMSHNDEYLIMSEQHEAIPSTGMHRVTYLLRAADDTDLFLINTDEVNSNAVMDI